LNYIDIRNYREVEWAIGTRFQADRDLFIMNGVRGSVIDPSANPGGSTCKIGMDATFKNEMFNRFRKVEIPKEVQKRVLGILDEVGGKV